MVPSCACATDHVEIVAWLRRRVGVDIFHDLLEDTQRRQTTHTTPICSGNVRFKQNLQGSSRLTKGEQTELLVSHAVDSATPSYEKDELQN